MMTRCAVWTATGVLWVGVFATGCSLTGAAGSRSAANDQADLYVAGVPFFHQQTYHCGPVSLASVLNYWGDRSTPDDIAEAIYSPRLSGTLGMDMWSYAQARHFKAEMRSGSLQDLEALLRRNRPVIAFLDLGYAWFPLPHFVVVVGLDTRTSDVILHDGRTANRRMPYRQFLEAWEKTNSWTLVVQPPAEA